MPYYGIQPKTDTAKTLYLSGIQTENATTSFDFITSGTYPWSENADITSVIIENELAPTSLYRLFYGLASVTTIIGLEKIDTSNVTTMKDTFRGCESLKTLYLKMWDTSNVTTMDSMFQWCTSLKNVNIDGWDTSKVTQFSLMFYNCRSLENILCSQTWTGSGTVSSGDMFGLCLAMNCNSGNISLANPTTGLFTIPITAAHFGITINEIPKSVSLADDSIYNGKGYKENTYINNKQEMYVDNISTTGFIPFTIGDTVYFKNLTFAKTANHRISFYDANKAYLGYTGGNVVYCTMTVWISTFDENDCYTSMTPTTYVGEGTAEGAAYIRISAADIDENSIITVNQDVDYSSIAKNIKNFYFGVTKNKIRSSIGVDGNIYNGCGFKKQTYVNIGDECSYEGTDFDIDLTGLIPFSFGDTLYFKNFVFDSTVGNCRLYFYDADKNYIDFCSGTSAWYMETIFGGVKDANGYYTQVTLTTADINTGAAYVRVSAKEMSKNSVITINEEAPETAEECDIAHSVIKCYIGDENGIARLFWSSFPVETPM